MSHVTSYLSPVTSQLSPATCHLSLCQQLQPKTLPLITPPLCTVGCFTSRGGIVGGMKLKRIDGKIPKTLKKLIKNTRKSSKQRKKDYGRPILAISPLTRSLQDTWKWVFCNAVQCHKHAHTQMDIANSRLHWPCCRFSEKSRLGSPNSTTPI